MIYAFFSFSGCFFVAKWYGFDSKAFFNMHILIFFVFFLCFGMWLFNVFFGILSSGVARYRKGIIL